MWTLYTSDQATAQLMALSPGDYLLSLQVADVNYLPSLPDSATVHVRDNQPPVAVATAHPGTVGAGETVHFDGSQSYDPEGGPLTYLWVFSDGTPALFAGSTISHAFLYPGDFDVNLLVTDERGAYNSNSVMITVTPPTSVEPRPEHLQLVLYGTRPNPATGLFTVWFTLPSAETAALEVLDVAGRRVVVREVGSLGPGLHQLPMPGRFPPGLYFVRLTQGGTTRVRRAVVLE